MLSNKENYYDSNSSERKRLFLETFTFGSMFEIKHGYSIRNEEGRNNWIDTPEQMIVVRETNSLFVEVFYINAKLKGHLYAESECFNRYYHFYKKIV